MPDDLRAEPDQTIAQRGQRPMPDRFGQREGAAEIRQVERQRVPVQPKWPFQALSCWAPCVSPTLLAMPRMMTEPGQRA
ncbi:MAG: hypothetical protein ACOYOH_04810 [Paracraurococcus sp.]